MVEFPCMIPTSFTPGVSAAGGIIIGISAGALMLLIGELSGLSGIFSSVLSLDALQISESGCGCQEADKKDQASSPPPPSLAKTAPEPPFWKATFASGFGIAAFAAARLLPAQARQLGFRSGWAAFVVGGLLVGIGTRLGNGCTSGHGICGLARLSRRSLVAVLTFMTSGVAAAAVAGPYGWFCNDAAASTLGGEGVGSSGWDEALPMLQVGAVAASALIGVVPFLAARARRQWKEHVAAFLCGSGFAAGLVLSGMAQRAKVVNFLQMRPGAWDPSLMFVMGSAVPVTHVLFRWALSRPQGPVVACGTAAGEALIKKPTFQVPTSTDIDLPLVLGAWLFGIGWGASGLCPGPAWVLAVQGYPKVALGFLPAMALGMRLAPPIASACRMPVQLQPCPAAPCVPCDSKAATSQKN